MTKYIFTVSLILLAVNVHAATTRYVDENLGGNCTGNYSIASRACSGSDGDAYTETNINAAIAASSGGDTVYIRTGTYTTPISDASITWPTTSESSRLTISAYNSEVVTVSGSATQAFNQTKTTTAYTDIVGIKFSSIGAFPEVIGLQGHHLRFINVEANGNSASGACNAVLLNEAAHHIEFTGGQYYGPGVGPGCGGSIGVGYGFYILGADNIIEHAKIHTTGHFAIHNYNHNTSPSRNIYRYNEIYDTCQSSPGSGAAVLLAAGTDLQAYGNVIRDTASGNCTGITIGNGAANARVYNNTIVRGHYAAIGYGSQTGVVVRNNISWTNSADLLDLGFGSTITASNNRGDAAGSGISTTASPGFVNAASNIFSLTSTSAMINAGVAAIASGITRCTNGSAPDIGAIESMGTPTATVDGTALTITVENNCTLQILPATSVTGFTVKKNGSSDTVNSNARSGSNSFAAVLANAFVGGDTCLISYAQSGGNAFSDNNIGGATTNNQEIFDFTDVACTNLTGGGGSTPGLEHHRIYLLQGGTPGGWIAKCLEDAADCVTAPGSKLWVLVKMHNSSGSAYPSFNYRPRVRYNAGSFVTITDGYVNGIKMLGDGAQLGTVITSGTSITTMLTTSEAMNVYFCTANRTAASVPTVTLDDDTETECATAIDISTSAAIGDVYEFCPYDDAGTALTCTTPIKITIGSYGAAR